MNKLKAGITNFYNGLYVSTLPLIVGLLAIIIGTYIGIELIGLVGAVLMAIAIPKFKDLKKVW